MNIAPIRRVAAATAAALLLTSCGSLPDRMDFLAGTDEFVQQSPRSIAKAAFADMQDVTSVRILGSQEDKKYGFTRVDIRLNETSCSGSLDTAVGTIRLLRNPAGAWFSADEDFWRANAGASPQVDKLVRDYAGRWSAIKGKNALLDLCDFDALLDGFALDEDDTEDSIEAGDVVEVGDADAVPVTGQDGRKRVTAWVAVEAPHHVLKMAPAEDSGRPDELFFEEFEGKVVAESPDKKDIVVLPTS